MNNESSGLTLKQCSQQLLSLGYRKDLLSCDNLKRILSFVREMSNSEVIESSNEKSLDVLINFEEFCVISSYLSVLQQEIDENCCVSPIKGTNLPPPPIFLTNTPGKH